MVGAANKEKGDCMTQATIDTNVLLDYPDVIDKFDIVCLPTAVLEEIDNLKKNKEIGHKARAAARKIAEANNIDYIVEDNFDMPEGWDKNKLDNKIIMCAVKCKTILVSNDLSVRAKARSLNITVQGYEEELYTGVKVLEGDHETILKFFEEGKDKELLENQYLIVRETDTGEETEMVFRNGTPHELRLPPSHVIKGLNAHQRCALDLLMNKDIPIKILAGEAGSGKTKLSVEVGYYSVVEKNEYEKMVIVRNPIGSGEEIGFLPGSFDEKVKKFYAPLIENLGDEGDVLAEEMISRNQLKKEIPFNMKGVTLNNSFIIVDEAEDLDLKTLKLIGTRVGKNSVIVFSGDYDQAEGKFVHNNGLIKLIESTKGNKLVGIVVLQEDVRSSASKIFARLK